MNEAVGVVVGLGSREGVRLGEGDAVCVAVGRDVVVSVAATIEVAVAVAGTVGVSLGDGIGTVGVAVGIKSVGVGVAVAVSAPSGGSRITSATVWRPSPFASSSSGTGAVAFPKRTAMSNSCVTAACAGAGRPIVSRTHPMNGQIRRRGEAARLLWGRGSPAFVMAAQSICHFQQAFDGTLAAPLVATMLAGCQTRRPQSVSMR